MKSKFNKTTLSTCNAFIGLALAISTTTASADISVVRTAAISHVNSTKNGFATTHLGTTARTFDTTGVSKLVVVFSGEPGNNNQVLTITGVSFKGTPMTKAVNDNTRVTSSNDCGDVAIYYLDNPAVDTAGTFSFTASSTSGAINGGIATILGISGAAPGVGITAKTSTSSPTAASTPSTSITTSGPNSLVIAAVQNSGANNSAGTPTATAPLIQIHNGSWGSQWGSLASARQTVMTSGATITPTFSTAAGGNIHVIAAEFKDATFTSITKADNADNLNLTNSWVGAAVPGLGDVAVWDSTVTSANTTSLGANIAFAGIKILDPGGAVTINAGNTLTLGGPAIDLDLSTATQNLTVNSDLVMSAPHVWDVAASRTLTLGGAVSGAQPVTKHGLGVVTLSGASTYTGDTTVTAGSLSVSGSLIGSTTLGNMVVSDTAGNNAVVNIGGNMTFNRLQVGTITGAAGAVNLSAGTVTAGADNELTFTFGAGATTGGYGSLRMTGGTINTSRFQFGGQNVAAQNGVGVGLISNGTVNASSWVIMSRFGTTPGTIGSLTVTTGGVLNHTSATAGQNLALGWQGAGRAELNLNGGTITSASGRVMAYGGGGATWTGTGIVNLNAGTLTTTAVTSQGTGASSYLNFAGGTIKAVSTQANFLPALTGVYVNGAYGAFSGGAVIDTNGVNITIPAALITPTGNGVATIPVTSGGSGYIGAPAISITDGGAGFGATAIANMIDDGTGNGTFTIDSITITNPGNNYTAPVASLVGGGNGVTAATLGALTTAANTSGGLTKNGFGTLTLNGANTFTGATSVSDGSLVVNGSLASSAVSLASVATLGGVGSLAGTVTVDSGAQITAGNGTSGTLSTQNLTFSGTGAINVGPLGNYTTNPAIDTPGVLTLNGGAGAVTLNLNTAPVASGTYRLVRAASGIADASGFTLGTAPTPVGRQAAGTLQYDGGTNTVTYTTGGTYPIWSGAQSSEWSTNSISPSKNWQLADMSGGTDFIANDDVLFDNSGTLKTVDISNGDVFPSVVSFTNTGINDYTLQGINGIAGTAVLIKTGSGKLTITNPNSHTGGTTISSGILAFANGSLGTSGPITVNGGTLQWDGANTQDISSRLTLVNATTATLDTNGNDVTLASALGGGTSGGLTKVGSGILTLSAANTYTGITNINSGTLKIGNATSLGTQTGTTDRTIIASGATLDLGGVGLGANNEFVTVSGSGVGGNGAITSSGAIPTPFIGVRFLTLAGDTTLGFTNRWDVGNNTTGGTLTGGGFTLNIFGSGVGQASLNGLGETDLGDININLGNAATAIAYLQGNTTLGQPGKTVTIAGGSALEVFTSSTLTSYDKKFDLNDGTIRIAKTGAMSLPGTIKLTGAGTITANAAAVAITSSNEISGNGNFIKAGAGSLALAGANVFTGTTTVSAGSIIAQHPTALGDIAGGTSVANGARVELDNIAVAGEAITLIGNGTNNLGALQSRSGTSEWSGNITIDADGTRIGANNGASMLVSGVIDDGASDYRLMYRVGDAAGSVTVSGANTYSGGSSIVGTGPVIVGSLNSVVGGTVSSNLGAPITEPNGKIIIGTAAVNGTLRYVGGGETTDRTIQIGENATTPVVGDTGSAAIENNGTTGALVFSAPNFNTPTNAVTGTSPTRTLTLGGTNSNANTISGIIQNNQIAGNPTAAVALTKTGTGSWALAGANSYTGATTIDQGTLAFSTTDQSLTGGLVFGTANGAASNGTLDLSTASATFAGAAVVRTNSTTPNAISIGTTRTLTLSGGLTLGYDAAGGTNQTDSMLTVSGLGGMVVNGTTINISVNQAAVNAGYWSKGTLDVSGLAAFSTDVTTFNIGVGSTTHGPGDVLLSNTANTILATTLQVGVTGANNGRGTSTLTLGTGTNVIQADTINIGRNKSSGPGVVKFVSQTAGSPGTLTIADKAGTGRANLDIANMVSTATAGGAIGNLDLRGHAATVSAGTVTMGNTSAASNSGSTNGTLSFDAGAFDVNTLTMATKSGGGTGTATATVNVGGGTFTVNTGFTMGSQTGSGASLATLNLTGGTLTSSASIVKGAGTVTSIINLSGGTLDLTGNAIGSGSAAITLNAEAGTLSNVASINATGGLTKTTAGTLLLSGTNTYVGDTTVSEGTLILSSAPDPLNANTANDASTVTIAATGATLNLTYTGTDLVDKLFIGASQRAAGVYGHTNSGATNGGLGVGAMDAYFGPGSGTLTVASGNSYASWAAINAIGSAANLDKDGDGVNNAVEYVLGGDVNTNDISKLPQSTISGTNLIFTFQRKVDTIDGSTVVKIEVGTTLAAWPTVYTVGADTAGSTPGVVVTEDSSPGFDTITLTVPMGTDPTKFARLAVEVP